MTIEAVRRDDRRADGRHRGARRSTCGTGTPSGGRTPARLARDERARVPDPSDPRDVPCRRSTSRRRACRSTRRPRSGSRMPTRTRTRSRSSDPATPTPEATGIRRSARSRRMIASLERTEAAMSFASGMAAIHTLWTSHVGSGDRIVATNALYGGAFALATTIMPRFGVTVDTDRRPGPGRDRPRAPGRLALLHGDDRQPDDGGRRSGGVGGPLPAARRTGSCRQHFRVSRALQPGSVRFRLRAALLDEVPRRAPRPRRRRDRMQRRRTLGVAGPR